LKAQGCLKATTLGRGSQAPTYPEGVGSPFPIRPMQPLRGRSVVVFPTQGSRCAATLGYVIQPLRGKWKRSFPRLMHGHFRTGILAASIRTYRSHGTYGS